MKTNEMIRDEKLHNDINKDAAKKISSAIR